jgi:hypothetical protein
MSALENIEDDTNIVGLAGLINERHVNDKLDVDKIEKDMIGTPGIKIIDEVDPAHEFEKTIKELSTGMGLDLHDGSDSDSGSDSSRNRGRSRNRSRSRSGSSSSSSSSRSRSRSGSSSSSDSGSDSSRRKSRYRRNYNYYGKHKSPYHNRANYTEASELDDILRAYTGSNGAANIEHEKEEDMKAILLEDIDELKSELDSDGIDLSRIVNTDANTPMAVVKNVHKILRMKYDRKRSTTLGSELILAGAQGLGYVLNGKNKIGPFAPDLQGWHNTVRPKLRRMRYETSTVVSSVMREFDMGPVSRIAFELIPSAFLYSNMRKEQNDRTNYSQDQMSEAFDDLRQFD